MYLNDSEDFELDGRTFRMTVEHDQDMREPWNEHDCYGIVSDWTHRDKAPGERVLVEDGRTRRYYDFQGTMEIALRDGWGTTDGRQPGETKRQYAARAVEEDFKRLRAWCNDEWYWVTLEVQETGIKCPCCGQSLSDERTEYLGGLASDDDEYLRDTARELAAEIIARYPSETNDAPQPVAA